MKKWILQIFFQDGDSRSFEFENKQEVEKKIDEVFKEGIKFQVNDTYYFYPSWAIQKVGYGEAGESEPEVVVLG